MSEGAELLLIRAAAKKDPEAYVPEFRAQLEHLHAQLLAMTLQRENALTEDSEDLASAQRAKERAQRKLAETVDFCAHLFPVFKQSGYLPKEAEGFVDTLLQVLRERAESIGAALRKAIVQSLIMLRNRGCADPIELFPVFFALFQCPDRPLRQMVFGHVIGDVTRTQKVDQGQANAMQNYIFKVVRQQGDAASEIASRKALAIMVELYRKHVWDDKKTVNVIAHACLSDDQNLAVAALNFFINAADDEFFENGEEMTEEEKKDRIKSLNEQMDPQNGSKKTRKKIRSLMKMKNEVRKLSKEQESNSRGIDGSEFGPIHLLFDPQDFSEKLFSALKQSKHKFDVRILYMNVISRTISCHKLCLLNFYPFLQKYIRPHQRFVTQIIAYTIQATHSQVLPEVLEPIVRTLCNEFVTDRSGPESMAVGINSIRELCKRQPLVMDEALLNDLVQYKKHRDKSVIMSARSLIGLFREVNPELLNKKDRGKEASENLHRGEFHLKEFGENDGSMVIEPEELAAKSILDDDEMHQLSTWKLRKKMKLDKKSESDEESGSDEESDKIVDPSSLEAYRKIKRKEREDMLESIKEKKEKPYGARKPGGGTTNEEKLRLKPFQFAKYSKRVQNKIMNSLGQKNSTKAKHAHTMKVRDKKRRRCRRT